MDVPDIMLNGAIRLSPTKPVIDVPSDQDANISTPGAAKSGYKRFLEIKINEDLAYKP